MDKYLKRLLGEGYLFISLGFVGIIVVYIVEKILASVFPDSLSSIPAMVTLVRGALHGSYQIFMGSLLVGAALSYITRRSKEVWAHYSPDFESRVNAYKSEILQEIGKHSTDEIVQALEAHEARLYLPKLISKV
jgi:hypothetical protein